MTYTEALEYLESFINYEKIPHWPYKESLKLERIKNLLLTLANPQDSLNCFHIAGTKGKGSTCAFISYILREAGYNVGLYTSPHLSDFRERIRILTRHQTPDTKHQDVFEGMISKDELIDLAQRLKPAIERHNRSSKYGPLSFFEIYTALAFVHFKEKKTDFVVLETGLGGRLDATSVVNPLVCVITPISYEHIQKLGHTLKKIAFEKAGIIKSSRQLIVISAPQEEAVTKVLKDKCRQAGAKLYWVGKDIKYQKTNNRFKMEGIFGEYSDLQIRLRGEHQLINAAAAVGAIEALRNYNISVDIDAIRKGLYNTVWPGRCEVISKKPLVVLDGAQNVASVSILKQSIKENFKYKRLILVLGVSKDKDIKGVCGQLYDLADQIVLTKADNPRATEPEQLAKYFMGKDVRITNNVKKASVLSRNLAKKEDLILVCGSLFVVGEFRNDGI